MKVCPNCGQSLKDADPRCWYCGADQSAQTGPTTVTLPESAAATVWEELRDGFRGLLRDPRLWIGLGLGIVLIVLGPWAWQQLQPKAGSVSVTQDPRAVGSVLRQQLDALVQETVPDKIEWARGIIRQRMPFRFSDELLLELDQPAAEVRYDNEQKNSVTYHIQICYHFDQTPKRIYQWQGVSFSFQQRDGVWTLVGESWIKEENLTLE